MELTISAASSLQDALNRIVTPRYTLVRIVYELPPDKDLATLIKIYIREIASF